MILYGAVINQFKSHITHTHFTLRGGMMLQAGPEEVFSFPLYGALVQQRLAPSHFTIYGPIRTTLVGPTEFSLFGSNVTTLFTGINISGLVVSEIAIKKTFSTPSLKYNIYPYIISDIKEIFGTTKTYQIIGYDLLFTELPEGPITLLPYNRLQIYADEIRQLEVINTVSNKLDFTDILISGDFQFSLNATGPWTDSLEIADKFYIKAPSLLVDGSDYTKRLQLTATAVPIG